MILLDDLLKYFEPQVAVAEPVTTAVLDEMRDSRRQLAKELGLEDKLPASLAELDGREGQSLYFYMVEEFVDTQPIPTRNIKMAKIWSADIDTLAHLEFVNMSGKFPRFKEQK
jgi:hypothetical protein